MSFHFPGFRFATYPTDKTEFLFLLAHKLLSSLLWAKMLCEMLCEKKFRKKKMASNLPIAQNSSNFVGSTHITTEN